MQLNRIAQRFHRGAIGCCLHFVSFSVSGHAKRYIRTVPSFRPNNTKNICFVGVRGWMFDLLSSSQMSYETAKDGLICYPRNESLLSTYVIYNTTWQGERDLIKEKERWTTTKNRTFNNQRREVLITLKPEMFYKEKSEGRITHKRREELSIYQIERERKRKEES